MNRALRWSGYAAIGWTLLYVASKVHFAFEGRLGVLGGPTIPPESYAGQGPHEVRDAQLGNAAAGLLVIVIVLAAQFVARPRWVRGVLLGLLGLCTVVALAGAVGFLWRALVTDRGGAMFGLYSLVWTVLLALATLACHRRGRSRS